jgi:L-ribulokinase
LLDSSAIISRETGARLKAEWNERLIPELSRRAAQLPAGDRDELAVDWLNGRRTPDADQRLKAALTGLTLGTEAPAIFKALVEATCFGAKAIVDRFNQEDVPVKGLIGLGGVARKSPYIMQVMADVMNMPIRIHRSEQTCALGAAMFAATAAGIHASAEEAMQVMGHGFDKEYKPDRSLAPLYARRFAKYSALGSFVEGGNKNMADPGDAEVTGGI